MDLIQRFHLQFSTSEEKSKNKIIPIGISLGAAALIIVIGLVLYFKRRKNNESLHAVEHADVVNSNDEVTIQNHKKGSVLVCFKPRRTGCMRTKTFEDY